MLLVKRNLHIYIYAWCFLNFFIDQKIAKSKGIFKKVMNQKMITVLTIIRNDDVSFSDFPSKDGHGSECTQH